MRAASHPSDGQQGDIRRLNAEIPCGRYVAEFVEQHAQEQKDDEQQACNCRFATAGSVVYERNPGKKQKKSDVDPDFGPSDTANGQ
jgi:hypothetical protein